MTLYRNSITGRLTVGVRSEHRVDLRDLTLALYYSNETLGEELSIRTVRATVSDVLAAYGADVGTRISDSLREAREYDDAGSLVGSETDARLEWARRLVLKAYRAEYAAYVEGAAELAAFEALPIREIT